MAFFLFVELCSVLKQTRLAYWHLADIRSLANAALRFRLRVPGKLCCSSAESRIRCDHEMRARRMACGIVWLFMRIFPTTVICVSITIKLNEVFRMSCDSAAQIFWVKARDGVCIRDGLLAFDRQARVPVRPN